VIALHWTECRELERIIDEFEQRDVVGARKKIVETTSADEMLCAIIELIEFQSAHFATAAFNDTSKYPQRLEGCAKGLAALLEYDLYRLRNDRRIRKATERTT
jgi:hypothetical protein